VPRLFKLPTPLLKYLDLLQGLQSPCPPGCYTYMIVIMKYIIYINYSGRVSWTHPYCIQTITPCALLTYLSFEKKMLGYQLCSTHYVAVQINNCLKRTFVIKVATMKITDDLMETTTYLPLNWHFLWWTKINGAQRRAMLSPWRRHCMYSDMGKAPLRLKRRQTSGP